MAKATVRKLNSPRTVRLELTEGEADFILGVTAQCAGEPNSPNKYASRIRTVLIKTLGYDWEASDAFIHGLGEIQFFPYDTDEPTVDQRMAASLAVTKASKVSDTEMERTYAPSKFRARLKKNVLRMFAESERVG